MKELRILILEDSDRIPTVVGRFKADALRKVQDVDFAVYVASTGFVELIKPSVSILQKIDTPKYLN